MDPIEDGTQHINISQSGKTPLGRMLAPPFEVSFEIGGNRYDSVEDYWRSLVSEHGEDFTRTEEFRRCILRATWKKINQNHSIFWRVEQNILPYRRYFVYEDDVYVSKEERWFCKGINVIEDHIEQNFW